MLAGSCVTAGGGHAVELVLGDAGTGKWLRKGPFLGRRRARSLGRSARLDHLMTLNELFDGRLWAIPAATGAGGDRLSPRLSQTPDTPKSDLILGEFRATVRLADEGPRLSGSPPDN